nr:unnamed protein product [Spirometra erinaceieuropaei]
MITRVTDDGAVSEALAVTNRVKQGCVLAPTLFSLMFSAILMDAHRDERPGIRIATRTTGHLLNQWRMHFQSRVSTTTVHELLIADDCALNTTSKEEMQRSMDLFSAACENFALVINTQRTVVVHRPPSDAALVASPINVNSAQLKVVKNYLYLDSILTCSTKIDNKMAGVSQAFARLGTNVWNRHGLRLNTKLKVYRAVITPTPLFSTTMADEYADLKQMLQQQLKLVEALTVKLSNSSMGQSSAAGGSQSVDHIADSITEFLYDPQAHITFDSWYKRYEDLFSVDLAAQDDAWKVRLLLCKLGPAEHERYANFILPKNPREVAFKDTVETLSQIFGEQSSLFNTRFQCLQLCKRDSDDFITYAGIVNHFGQADALSRLISNQQEPEEDTVIAAISIEDDVRRQLSDAVRGIPVTAADIRRATEQDPVLRQAITYVQTCWTTTALAGDLRQLFLRRASLSVVDSCLMFADRVVIPSSLRPTVLRQFHAAHPGTSRMKSIARSFAYWPGIDGDIYDLVRRCSRCQQAAKMPPRQPPVPWEPPERPWSRVHIDFAGPLNGVSYLILVDAYSKWPEIAPLNPATASSTIAFLRRIFSQHGLPEVLVSDNGSQFTSSLFEDFCRQHLRSPPYHPQSNGQAERFVDTFKRALLKARGEGTTDEIVQAFLYSYRTTPNPASPGGVSPAEALMGRKLRTTFHALVPTGAQPAQTSPVSRSKLSIGTPVFARDYRAEFPDWIEATVVAHRGSMLFDVDVGDEIWVRHHNQIRRRHCSNTTGLDPAPSLPLDILLDTFAIPADRSVPEPTAAPPADVPPSISLTAPGSPDNKPQLRRRTNRVRRSTVPLQINPRQKRY